MATGRTALTRHSLLFFKPILGAGRADWEARTRLAEECSRVPQSQKLDRCNRWPPSRSLRLYALWRDLGSTTEITRIPMADCGRFSASRHGRLRRESLVGGGRIARQACRNDMSGNGQRPRGSRNWFSDRTHPIACGRQPDRSNQVVFNSTYLSSACSDLSRPLPDSLKPPKGTVRSPAS